MARLWLNQVKALLVKNVLTMIRSPIFPLTVLLFPPLFSAILVSVHANQKPSRTATSPLTPGQSAPVSQLHFGCDTTGKCPVLYFAPNDAYHTSVMTPLASMARMKVGELITGFATYNDMSAAFFENAGDLTSPDTYFAAIAWTSEDIASGATFPNVTAYNVWEAGPPTEFEEGTRPILKRNREENPEFAENIGLQIALESAAVSVISELSRGGAPISTMMDVSMDWLNVGPRTPEPEAGVPSSGSTDWYTPYRNEAYNVPLTFFIPLYPIVLFAYTLYSICREKQSDHLSSMKMMGRQQSAFWVSATTIPLILNFFSTMASALILTLAGGFAGWPLLQSVDLPSMWLLQFSFGCAMIGTALLLSSVVTKTSYAYSTIVFYFLMHCAVPSPVFATPAWLQYVGHTAVHMLTLLFIPVLTFGKVWFEVLNTAMPTVMNSYQPANFTLSTAFNTPRGPVDVKSLYYVNDDLVVSMYSRLPSAGFSLISMIVAIFFVAILLACYIDQVFGGRYDCLRQHWYFPFTAGFWSGRAGPRGPQNEGDQVLQWTSASLGTVEIERLAKDMGRRGWSTTAIDIPRLTLQKGSCCALLGVKGSGKTTAIETLTGMSKASAGSVFFGGLDIQKCAQAIRSKIGVSFQVDTLYLHLTAAEHVQFYAKLRGVNPVVLGFTNFGAFTLEMLRKVDLAAAYDTKVTDFTDGMKSRLLLLLTTIGPDVQFIFLDDITASVDSSTRKSCWKYVEELKKDKMIFLTTSSAEEAEILADLICILVKGKMVASGSQSFLRSRFCEGYFVQFRASGSSTPRAPEMMVAPQRNVGTALSAPMNVFRPATNHASNDMEMQNIPYTPGPPSTASLLENWVKECIPNSDVLLMDGEKLDISVPWNGHYRI
ncbi:hypothetical protein BJ742DRAFT_360136 [Cladochytrium replicatum]|nr:hypothetical protein BJ742DRAFT_360136 [Cladochytrium replicatum]